MPEEPGPEMSLVHLSYDNIPHNGNLPRRQLLNFIRVLLRQLSPVLTVGIVRRLLRKSRPEKFKLPPSSAQVN